MDKQKYKVSGYYPWEMCHPLAVNNLLERERERGSTVHTSILLSGNSEIRKFSKSSQIAFLAR
jgi:hypothetical protein